MKTSAASPFPENSSIIRAAAYVRMSTEHQQYSTSNQMDSIREYAARRNMEIVITYSDEGKSGLNIQGRQSLARMIADVQSKKADYKCILLYDISRWGRFQDADESAHYEYTCRRAGISSDKPEVFQRLLDGKIAIKDARRACGLTQSRRKSLPDSGSLSASAPALVKATPKVATTSSVHQAVFKTPDRARLMTLAQAIVDAYRHIPKRVKSQFDESFALAHEILSEVALINT